MAQQVISNVENNFTGGLKTEYTGLNFPENAATDTDNCIYTLVGNVIRRLGFDFEDGYLDNGISLSGMSTSTYLWNNAGGDGDSKLVVVQAGTRLVFFDSTAVTENSPLSNHLVNDSVDLSAYLTIPVDNIAECQYADGNGYLFVFNKNCSPIYVTYDPVTKDITSNLITVQMRDFVGTPDPLPVDFRPTSLPVGSTHVYNLQNQGWSLGSAWTASAFQQGFSSGGAHTFTVASGITGIDPGDGVIIYGTAKTLWGSVLMAATGTVTSYAGTQLNIFINNINYDFGEHLPEEFTFTFSITQSNVGYIQTWFGEMGNYPSNADVWWRFKDNEGTFSPSTTAPNTTLSTGPAPKGSFILNAFQQNRATVSGDTGILYVSTPMRPKTGCWFQGRVWYAGTDASWPAQVNTKAYSWTENIFFSQVVEDIEQVGKCYQTNDPTSETLFDLLPTDGGVIQIQGCGSVYKLFPIQNGLLVFAANGIWFITGSQGIGFAANDYTITKISSVRSISSTSFVNVQGLPYFWNEEGIYTITPSQQGLGLQVEPITLETIVSYYDEIPLSGKLFARGDYDPINYVITWIYSDQQSDDLDVNYTFNKSLCFNVKNKAFYPYSLETSLNTPSIRSILYVNSIGSVEPVFKYLTSIPGNSSTFSEERDESYLDWKSYDGVGKDYDSYFITGYKLHGQGQRRFQVNYIYVYSNAETPTSYKIQGIWDYANSGNSGKYTNIQLVTNALTRFSKLFRRHKIRGRGLVLQFKISSSTGMPFDINGWSVQEVQNTGV